MVNRQIFIAALIAGTLISFPYASTQPSAPQPITDAFFRQDSNRDGVITGDEWRGNKGEFDRLDTDHDGVLSAKDGLPLKMPLPSEIVTENDIVFKTAGNSRLAFDKYTKRDLAYHLAPVLLYIHGGYFLWGDKQDLLADAWLPVVIELVNKGYVCFSINYRLSGDAVNKTTIADCVSDCRDAVRFLVNNSADYGIDPQRIAVWGTSAGGHLALMMLMPDDRRIMIDPALSRASVHVNSAVDWFGPTDWQALADMALYAKDQSGFGTDTQIKMFGVTACNDPGWYAFLSPISYISAGTCPVMVVHGDRDTTVPVDQSRRLVRQAMSAGARVEYLEVKNAAHRFVPSGGTMSPGIDEINRKTVDFILANNVKR